MLTLSNPQMPLAVYRELAAHLCQLDGVKAEVLSIDRPVEFSYLGSQAGGLQISIDPDMPVDRSQLEQILAYYSDRFGPWIGT
jgi:hypothetical protein